MNLGRVHALAVGERKLMTAIGKRTVSDAVAVLPLGLAGDEQADLTVHGGLEKAVYAYPGEHYAYWQAERSRRGVSLFDEALPPGFAGENLTLTGLLEADVWVGDELHFPDCVLRVTAAREPCGKLNAVIGYAQAARDMVQSGRSGFYMAVQVPGSVKAGQRFVLVAGRRNVSVLQSLGAKRAKHRE